ncbi:hypothetical protein VTJ83DRAFT_5956 [Remersonia thermophila]|uniref:Anaphase-promoting complex subunit 2 n=1 Tax=Remersonia thermophila TaxID=72144 RepID=A0ABR4D8A6_9PEZI
MPAAVASQWRDRQRRVFQSVFPADVAQPAAHPAQDSLPGTRGRRREHIPPQSVATQPLLHSAAAVVAGDQAAREQAWRLVTAHIALPPPAAGDVSLGSLVADSQQQHLQSCASAEFYEAFEVLVHAKALLPGAAQTDDVLSWHFRQVRAHYTRHVLPLLARCVDDGDGNGGDEGHDGRQGDDGRDDDRKDEEHMVIVTNSIRTLEAALRLYFFGLNQLLSGYARLAHVSPEIARDAESLNDRFRRDLHALVSNSAPTGLMRSIKAVVIRLAGAILGMPGPGRGEARDGPDIPDPEDSKAQAARERLLQLTQQLHNVGLTGERFQALFAEVMDVMMSKFVTGAFAGAWSPADPRPVSTAVSLSASLSAASPCIAKLSNWIENHFARLTCEVLASISANNPQGPLPVSLADVKMYQSLALGRLAALRIQELFDIALAWPDSRPALEDLRATITTPARRKQLTDGFSKALQRRLLHPGCSTLQILRTYISIIRTLHALDPTRVLLSSVERDLQMYLCQREDAIRVVVAGLLASPEEMRAEKNAREGSKRQREKAHPDRAGRSRRRGRAAADDPLTATPSKPSSRTPQGTIPETPAAKDPKNGGPSRSKHPPKLVELALLLHEPSPNRAASPAEDAVADLDWDDMNWVPDPIDAGDGYRRPRSVDVIGTIIAALGSGDTFIKEFSIVMADRLLADGNMDDGGSGAADSAAPRFDQELRVLALLKRRFGEASLQACDVMIRDIQDSRRVDGILCRERARERERGRDLGRGGAGEDDMDYHTRILSRLFWPGLDREHFLLPPEVERQQKRYEAGYESLKSRRKLTWLNQLGRARVELELRDRTVAVDCSTVEATVIRAFQGLEGDGDDPAAPPVQKSVDDLYMQLQMDEDLIAAALQFWAGHGVLRRVGGPGANTYAVVESLADEAGPGPGSAAGAAASDGDQPMDEEGKEEQQAAPEGEGAAAGLGGGGGGGGGGLSAKELERREVYWRYVQGMLTNASASMPLAQMAMMMRMLIPDGFAWSNEELQDFLAEKVAAGEMEIVGGKYRLVKK